MGTNRHEWRDGIREDSCASWFETRSASRPAIEAAPESRRTRTRQTEGVLRSLAKLQPKTLAVMHGSSFSGEGDRRLNELAEVIRENFDEAS